MLLRKHVSGSPESLPWAIALAASLAACAGTDIRVSQPPPTKSKRDTGPQAECTERVSSPGGEVLSKAQLLQDLKQLVGILVDSHPEPFGGPQGRIGFFRLVQRVKRSIPQGGMSRDAFLRALRPIVAALRDGHTYLRELANAQPLLGVLIDLDPLEKGLVVKRVYREADRIWIGARVLAIGRMSIPRALEKMGQIRGYDNHYNNLVHLADLVEKPRLLQQVIGHYTPTVGIPFLLKLPNGPSRTVTIPLGRRQPGQAVSGTTTVMMPTLDAADMGWAWIGGTPKVALLKIRSMMRYREAFEIWNSVGFRGTLGTFLDRVATKSLKGAMPQSVQEKIAAVPSAAETFLRLLGAMRHAGAKQLIIDLRDNGGGNSAIVTILEYFLYGKESILKAPIGYQIPRYSDLYFQSHAKRSKVAVLGAKGLLLGDYDFTNEDAWRARQTRPGRILKHLGLMPTFKRIFDKAHGKMWTPQITVLTSARTYSAAFQMVVMLRRHGAAIVGVPSSQAGNCFINALPFKLRYSEIQGSVSNKYTSAYPSDRMSGALLRPDRELRYADVAAMGFDRHASVHLALRGLSGWSQPSRPLATGHAYRWQGALDGALPLLRRSYALDEVIRGESTELGRLTALRDWVHHRWIHHCCNTPGRFDALSILGAAEQGRRFRCVEYSLVLAQVYRAMGWCGRFVRIQGKGGAHALTEVFAKTLKKWILMDGQHGAHISRGGVPLSLLEVKAAMAKGGTGLVAFVAGTPLDYKAWLSKMLDFVMVPMDMSYGEQLKELIVLVPAGLKAPERKPPYLRNTRYWITRKAAALYPPSCPIGR